MAKSDHKNRRDSRNFSQFSGVSNETVDVLMYLVAYISKPRGQEGGKNQQTLTSKQFLSLCAHSTSVSWDRPLGRSCPHNESAETKPDIN
jgi:hypothetical protein